MDEDMIMEEPNCLNCCYVCGGFDCEKHCGPEHWWAGFTPIGSNQEETV